MAILQCYLCKEEINLPDKEDNESDKGYEKRIKKFKEEIISKNWWGSFHYYNDNKSFLILSFCRDCSLKIYKSLIP